MSAPRLTVLRGHHTQWLKWLGESLRAQYWGAWLKDPQIERAMKNSMCFWLMRVGEDNRVFGEPIGFARIVSDWAIFSSITEVMVLPEWRGMGGGSKLVRSILSLPAAASTICIISTRDRATFYARFGFVPTGGNIMQRMPGVLVETCKVAVKPTE